jgi:DNA-binding CsgD family transcriptional regulator
MGNTEVLEVGSDRSAARAREDYVKAIHQLGTDGPVRGAALARYLGVSRVSVSEVLRDLVQRAYGSLRRGR